MGELDLHQLIRRYRTLRIAAPTAEAKLLASLAAQGQLTPVLVVRAEGAGAVAQYVLIDGYRRVAALERLGQDTVLAVEASMSEYEALLWHHQQTRERARTALEEAWLLRALCEQHGQSQAELSRRLGRPESWVSRRLALLTVLPEEVQQMVQHGKVCAHAAEKYLVPLARAKGEDCMRLARAVAGAPVSTRAMKRLYVAWRSGTAEQKQRIVDDPRLFLRAEAEVRASMGEAGAAALSLDDELALALDELARLGRRVCERLAQRDPVHPYGESVSRAWSRARPHLMTLERHMERTI